MAARKKTSSKPKPKPRSAAGKSAGKKSTKKVSSTKPAAKKPRQAKPAPKSAPGRPSTKLEDGPQRLQRVMAAAGIGSRRECETIIQEGRVEVDGNIIVTLGTKVDLSKQKVFVDGTQLRQQKLEYFMLNKPQGIVSTNSDPSGRPRVIDLIKTRSRVYNVGRLDQSSEGLILVTNDGELANRLTHPRYGIEKKYHVQVAGQPTPKELKALVDGVYLAEGKAQATSAKFIRRAKENSWIEITLTEGRNREIRRLLAKIGHKVRRLKRVTIGTLKLGELPTGAHRELLAGELRALKKMAFGKPPARKKKPVGARRKAKGLDELKVEFEAEKEAAQNLTRRKKVSDKNAERTTGRNAKSNRSAKTSRSASTSRSAKPVKSAKKRSTKKKDARSNTKSVSKRGAARDTTGRRVKKAAKRGKRR